MERSYYLKAVVVLVSLAGLALLIYFLVEITTEPSYWKDFSVNGINVSSNGTHLPDFDVRISAGVWVSDIHVGVYYWRKTKSASDSAWHTNILQCDGAMPTFLRLEEIVTLFDGALRGTKAQLSDTVRMTVSAEEVPLRMDLEVSIRLVKVHHLRRMRKWAVGVKVECGLLVERPPQYFPECNCRLLQWES